MTEIIKYVFEKAISHSPYGALQLQQQATPYSVRIPNLGRR
jgi:hypothetical protein